MHACGSWTVPSQTWGQSGAFLFRASATLPAARFGSVRSFNGVGVRDKIASVLVNPFVFAELHSANGSNANATFEVRSMRVGVRTWRHLCACTHALPRGSAAPEIRRGDSRG